MVQAVQSGEVGHVVETVIRVGVALDVGEIKGYLDPLAGRPVLMTSRRRSAASNEASLSFARLATAARRISLFFAETPAARQRFLSIAMTAYSVSGMVKLSRTSLAFFALAGLPALLFLVTKGSGSCVTCCFAGW